MMQRGAISILNKISEDELNREATPDEVEGADAGLEAEEADEAHSNFAGGLLSNLFSGRTRRQRIIGGDPSDNPTVQDGKLANQDFYELRQQALDSGELFVDPEFPPDDQSLYFSQDPPFAFEWKRASELSDDPHLFHEGASRFDINQGELGDCWLLAALANLTMNKKLLYKVVPKDQSFQEDYAGIFHFK